MIKEKLVRLSGIDLQPASHHEKLISGLGGLIGILAVFYVSVWFVGVENLVYIVPSMGASAVLVFAAPHVQFGQPWNTFGGHLISALIGVFCAKFIPIFGLAAAASVGLSITAMYYARCTHPPGGATALAAVIGGPGIHDLGFQYVVTPILINTVTILFVAVAFNYIFPWRRYPAVLAKKPIGSLVTADYYKPIAHEDLVYALSEIDSYIDISEEDLLEIYRLATGHKS